MVGLLIAVCEIRNYSTCICLTHRVVLMIDVFLRLLHHIGLVILAEGSE